MALISGKPRPALSLSSMNGPLDPALPNVRYLKPSLWWRMATHLPLVIALLIITVLIADWLRVLPSWVPFSSTHIVSR